MSRAHSSPGHVADSAPCSRDTLEEKLIQQYIQRSPRSPFKLDADGNARKRWFTFTPSDKLQALSDLCEWQLATDGRFRALVAPAGGPAEEAEWRLEPCGLDREGNKYWLFADNRLWVQHPEPKPFKPEPKPKKGKTEPKGKGASNTKGRAKAAATPARPTYSRSRRQPAVEELVHEDLGRRSSSRKRGRGAAPEPEPKGRALRPRASTSARAANPYASDKRQRTGLRSSRRLRGDPDEDAGSEEEEDAGWEQPPADWLEESTAQQASSSRRSARKGKGKAVATTAGSDSELSELSELSSLEDEEPSGVVAADTEQAKPEEEKASTTPAAELSDEPMAAVAQQDTKHEPEDPADEKGDDHAINGTPADAQTPKVEADAEADQAEAKGVPAEDPEDDDPFTSINRKDIVQVESWKARHRTFLEWEAVCVTRWDWEHFPERFKTSKDKSERALYRYLTEEAGPEAIEEFRVSRVAGRPTLSDERHRKRRLPSQRRKHWQIASAPPVS